MVCIKLILSTFSIASSEESVELGFGCASGLHTLGVGLYTRRLGKGDAERLGAHARGTRVEVGIAFAQVLNRLLAGLVPAERRLKQALLLEALQEGGEVGDDPQVLSELRLGPGIHA